MSLSFFVTFLQWFLQQLPEGQRKLIHAEKKEGDSGSKGGGIINISMQKQLEKTAFLKNLALNSASSSESDVQISIFSFSNKTLHTELLRVIAKFVATTGDDVLPCNTVDTKPNSAAGSMSPNVPGIRQFIEMSAHASLADAVLGLQKVLSRCIVRSDLIDNVCFSKPLSNVKLSKLAA